MTVYRKPFFVLPLDLGTMATGNAQAGYPVTNLNRPRDIGLVWQTSGNTNVWARGQFASAQSIDFCAMLQANALSGTNFRLRLGATQADVDGASAPYDSGVIPFPGYIDGTGTSLGTLLTTIKHSFLELNSPISATWWRVDITGHTGNFQAAALVLGQKIQPSYFYDTDFEFGMKPLGNLDFTRLGVADLEPGVTFRTVAFTLSWTTEAEFESTLRPLIEGIGNTGVVYCCFGPTGDAYRQNRTYCGVMSKSPVAKGMLKPGFFTTDWNILSPY